MVEKLSPDLCLKIKLEHMSGSIVWSVVQSVFILCQTKGYLSVLKLSCGAFTFTSYKAFLKNKKKSGKSLPVNVLHDLWRNIFLCYFWCNIGLYEYCNCLLSSLQCHIFQNQTYPFNQVVFFYKNEENILFIFKTKRWESEFNKKNIEVIEVLYMKHPPESGHIYEALDNYNELTLHKKWSFPLRIASFFMQCEVLGWPRIRPHAPQKKCISRLDLWLWSIAKLRLLPDWSASTCLSSDVSMWQQGCFSCLILPRWVKIHYMYSIHQTNFKNTNDTSTIT